MSVRMTKQERRASGPNVSKAKHNEYERSTKVGIDKPRRCNQVRFRGARRRVSEYRKGLVRERRRRGVSKRKTLASRSEKYHERLMRECGHRGVSVSERKTHARTQVQRSIGQTRAQTQAQRSIGENSCANTGAEEYRKSSSANAGAKEHRKGSCTNAGAEEHPLIRDSCTNAGVAESLS
ncbi:hypothetical protein C8F01DRAFT_1090649 [Mycena amicta]|nr:hypothetical protein C8F01DRAFT_1090649 [Mycena amicta]